MARDRLTALEVKRAHEKSKPVLLPDGAGLYLRKQSAQGSAWTLRYRFGGRDRWMALGTYPDMELAEARKAARAKRTLVDAGRDPLLEKQNEIEAQLKSSAAKKARGKFKELAEDWYETEIDGGRLKHPAVPRRYLDKYLLPEFGGTVAADISPAMAARLLARVARKAPTAANDLLRYMRRVFRFAVRRHLITSSPVADFNLSDAGGKESARQRSLSRDELEKLFKTLRDSPSFGDTNLLTIKLLLALGVRKGELLRARWSEFDLDGATDSGPVWRLSANRTKTAAPISIPLVPAVVGWLRSLAEISGGSEFVFPKRRRDRRQRALHVGIDTLNAALAGVDHGLDAFTIHDLRRTMRTHLSSLGIRSEVAERCLNHKLPGIQGVYNRHDYFAERRAALETWTALLLEIERGERRVAPLRLRRTNS
ncbi:MAG: tyrosine-type recombinase/integrase [Steroidobacteraceae bacterium]